MDISKVRDAFISARTMVQRCQADVMEEFYMPDKITQLGLMVADMPPEVRALLDEQTLKVIEEVLHGKPGRI